VWSYVDQLGVAVLTDDKTFNDPHEATDALTTAFARIARCRRRFRLGRQNSVQRRIEQAEPVVRRTGQRLDGMLGMRHQPDHAAVG